MEATCRSRNTVVRHKSEGSLAKRGAVRAVITGLHDVYCLVIDPRRTSGPGAYAGTVIHCALAQGQGVGGALRIAFASHAYDPRGSRRRLPTHSAPVHS